MADRLIAPPEPAWPYLLVLNLYDYAARCRFCAWVSPPYASVCEAQAAHAWHRCSARPSRLPRRWWDQLDSLRLHRCLCCGRIGARGLRPANPSMPRAWVRTWVCADREACRTRRLERC
jgi:hypothetical protein